MTRSYQPIDLSRVHTYHVRRRAHKVSVKKSALLPEVGATAAELIQSWPDCLGAASFRAVVGAVADAVRHERPVVVAFGAHVLKVGCGPILIDLIHRGVVSAIVGHGACAIHDAELALIGETSEEVSDTIRDGTFGMVSETMAWFTACVEKARDDGSGLGAAVGATLREQETSNAAVSVFAAASRAKIPAMIHVALGTDTVHVADTLDAAALGAASLRDFRLTCDVVSDLGAASTDGPGGVWLNIGSAVLLPEVFLKAVSVARNLGANLDAMTTANFDMIRHYRPHQNVVTRPVAPGRGHEVVGQHEIILPLFRQAVIEALA